MSTKKYYHITCVDYTTIVLSKSNPQGSGNNAYGPFDTLKECKENALDYHRATINSARMAMDDVKNTKKGDL